MQMGGRGVGGCFVQGLAVSEEVPRLSEVCDACSFLKAWFQKAYSIDEAKRSRKVLAVPRFPVLGKVTASQEL